MPEQFVPEIDSLLEALLLLNDGTSRYGEPYLKLENGVAYISGRNGRQNVLPSILEQLLAAEWVEKKEDGSGHFAFNSAVEKEGAYDKLTGSAEKEARAVLEKAYPSQQPFFFREYHILLHQISADHNKRGHCFEDRQNQKYLVTLRGGIHHILESVPL